ncbi:hypothetical protein BCD67_08760 [Oscillatoriales cyanobacterium USR001]|nr:hypothetical protein BCD67_08760 [Oscillatoriales cyanobacterium USR001]
MPLYTVPDKALYNWLMLVSYSPFQQRQCWQSAYTQRKPQEGSPKEATANYGKEIKETFLVEIKETFLVEIKETFLVV